jgi:hypothetical protein
MQMTSICCVCLRNDIWIRLENLAQQSLAYFLMQQVLFHMVKVLGP